LRPPLRVAVGTFSGGITLSESLAQPKHLPEQVMTYGNFVRLVFLWP